MISSLAIAAFAADYRYVGSEKCGKMCHNSEKGGMQYSIWLKGKHAAAFTSLGTEKAKEVAKKAGVTDDPQKSNRCVPCHVTGFGVKKELIEPTCTYNEGVGCEACHGPGSEYKKINNMKNHDLAVAAGLVEQKEAVCIRCHNKGSPVYKPFNFAEAVKMDAHPIPGKVKAK
jgi:hypothetical protein